MFSKCLVSVPDLQGKRISVEPVQQLHVQTESDIGELRCVYVTVNETRNQELGVTQNNFVRVVRRRLEWQSIDGIFTEHPTGHYLRSIGWN